MHRSILNCAVRGCLVFLLAPSRSKSFLLELAEGVVAASSRDLSEMVAQRQFRSDLFYRLNVFPIRLPSLRERSEDIPLLVRHFVTNYAKEMSKEIETVPSSVIDFATHYSWPGNVRELENFIERAVILSSGNVLNPLLAEVEESNRRPCAVATISSTAGTLEECERKHILQTLNKIGGVIGGPCGAATMLGLKRTTLISKMKKLGIAAKTKPQPQFA